MKANSNTAANISSIIRWTTGTATAAIILTISCWLFPLLSSFSAFTLVLCLSTFIGLNIALPPVDAEEDWIPASRAKGKSATSRETEKQATVIKFPGQVRTAV